VSNGNAPVVGRFLDDLRECVTDLRGRRTDDRSTNYATLE
jgi:hypothetical protein